MATYTELFELRGNSTLRNRVAVAMIVAAETIRNEDGGTANHANRLLWAKEVFQGRLPQANDMLTAVVAANKDATVAQIASATDAALQANVDAAVDVFATGA